MSNFFDEASERARNSSFSIVVWFLAVLLLLGSINLMAEDTMSSYYGFQQLETVFGLDPTNLEISYLTISLFPQLVQTTFVYYYLLDTKKVWALGVAFAFFLIDTVADVQDRSSMQFITLTATSVVVNWSPSTWVAILYSIGWTTIGSELAFTVGGGLSIALWVDAWKQINLITEKWDRESRRRDSVRNRTDRKNGRYGNARPVPPRPNRWENPDAGIPFADGEIPDEDFPRPKRDTKKKWRRVGDF